MMRQPKIERAFRMDEPHIRIVEIHEFECDCPACAPYVPSDPDRLTAVHMGKLACLGAVVASASRICALSRSTITTAIVLPARLTCLAIPTG